MPDVKWIKIVTDVFDNRKIKLIRKMPEGAELVVTWFQLLCLAGETNDNGLIYVTKTIPYTEETLATAFDTPLSIVRLALDTFQQLEMVATYNSFLCVANWEKYQSIDGLARIKELGRLRKQKQRAKQALQEPCHVTVTGRVTQCHATEEELEVDKEHTGDCKGGQAPGVKKFLKPTADEVSAYCSERRNGIDPSAFVDFYESKGWKIGKNNMKDWKAAVRTWERQKGFSPSSTTPSKPKKYKIVMDANGKEVSVLDE